YTNVSVLERRRHPTAAPPAAVPQPAALAPWRISGLGAHFAAILDGWFQPALTQAGGAPAGLRLLGLTAALDGAAPEVAGAYTASAAATPFAALNAALAGDGLLVDVAPGTVVAQPLHVLLAAGADAAGKAHYPRLHVRLGEGAELTLIEHYASLSASAGFTCAVTTVELGRGARLAHCKLQEEADDAYHVACMLVDQAASSVLHQHSISLGARLARHDLRVRLAGEGAEAVLDGLYLAGGRQHVDHHTRVDHLVPHTTSAEDYRGVLDGSGRGVFNGKVVVHPRARKSAARQSNRNLLLAPGAEADTKPELEIYADDVQCSHGATVGQLDAASLFYLRSRGIDAETARNLLVYAFADDIVARVKPAPLRTRIEAAMLGRLPGADRVREFV
ncbi:MAG: Fe-S cluster assembly protein SufD, partial [Gammaproteobacteria bacterium]